MLSLLVVAVVIIFSSVGISNEKHDPMMNLLVDKTTDYAYATDTACMPTSEAVPKSKIRNVPAEVVGKRALQCSLSREEGELIVAYAEKPISQDVYGSMESHDSILVTIRNMTMSGKSAIDVEKELDSIYKIVKEKRPDLKPRTTTINGHYAWGEEGGPNASMVTIEREDGTIVSRYTEPAPSRLYIANNGIQYTVQANLSLDELIMLAKDLG